MEGTPFGHYRLIEFLGRGGMGEVWRARDTEADRIVAIKVLPALLSEDEEFQKRFRREAHAAARLNSPHVIPIHRYGEIDGRLYLDMRLIEGRDLAAVLADGALDPARAIHIVGQVAKALQAAHRVGLLHRDIKPSNILLDEDDFAYLIDFGIARTIGETRMTQTGGAIGTYNYIAPERLAIGVDEDARADIYSLACVLYECLTGGPPFPGETMPQLVAAHLHAPPPRPSITRPGVPAEIDEVIATGMAKDPNNRYATTVELANAARDAITAPIPRPTPSPAPHQQAAQPPAGPVPAPAFASDQRQQPPPSPWAPAAARLRPESPAYRAPQFASPAPQDQRTRSPMPLSPQLPTPARVGGISRRTTIALITGAIALVAVIAAVVGISALVKYSASESVPLSPPPTLATSSTGSNSPPNAQGEAEVIIGGTPQIVSGPVVCATNGGRLSITIGDIVIGLAQDGSVVHNAALGTVGGVAMSFTEGAPGNSATATKNGNSYKVTGTATGVDNARQMVSKDFSVNVTCP